MVVTMTSVTWMYPSPGLSLAYTNSMRSHTSQWASCPYGSGTNSSLPFRLLTDIWWGMTVETMNIWYKYKCLVIGQTLDNTLPLAHRHLQVEWQLRQGTFGINIHSWQYVKLLTPFCLLTNICRWNLIVYIVKYQTGNKIKNNQKKRMLNYIWTKFDINKYTWNIYFAKPDNKLKI